MTGRELIFYILENKLENEQIIKNGRFIGLLSVGEVATKLDVGIETVKAWVKFGRLEGVMLGGDLYILPNALLKKSGE